MFVLYGARKLRTYSELSFQATVVSIEHEHIVWDSESKKQDYNYGMFIDDSLLSRINRSLRTSQSENKIPSSQFLVSKKGIERNTECSGLFTVLCFLILVQLQKDDTIDSETFYD